MTGRRSVALVLAAAALATVGAPAIAGARRRTPAIQAQPAAAPAHLLVYAQEWSLWPSRSSIPAGRVMVELWNRGQDAHDLRIRRLNTRGGMVGHAQAVATAQAGHITQAVWRLGRGTYELYCAMPGHMKLGMHARITVR